MERKEQILQGTDELTGGLNAKAFLKEAEKILLTNGGNGYAVVSFHVKSFKYINDLFGYENGNKVLIGIYRVMNGGLAPAELCARLNADRFALLLRYRQRSDLKSRLDEIRAELYRTVEFYGIHYTLEFRMGIYECQDGDPLNVSAMLDRAVIAQNSADSADPVPYRFYEEAMRTGQIIEKNMEDRLFPALQNHEFILYYQPKYRLEDAALAGCEALVRWKTDADTVVPPGEFIPVFEKSRSILPLDRYIFEEACKDIRRWLDCGRQAVPVSVNLSRMHLLDLSFIAEYKAIAESWGIPFSLLELELTESVLTENRPAMLLAANRLKESGFSLSIDDFGTGSSSLSMLKDIPADTLKLDRSFLLGSAESENGKKLLEDVVRLIIDLGITPLAEGVETREQVEFLKAIGCELAQGYYYAKPLPVSEYELLLPQSDTDCPACTA